jgi:hypothetical protein
MKIAIAGFALLTAAALAVLPLGTARALTPEPVLGFYGTETVSPDGIAGKATPHDGVAVATVVYDNTASAANFGFSSTDLTAVWGDELLTTSPGLLSAQKFSVYNSGSSAGPVLTALIEVDFYDKVTSLLIGGYTVNVTFGAGLNAGFYSMVNVTNLSPLSLTIPVTDIIVLQRVLSFTGTATRLGIVSLDPPTVGSSPNTMYIQASTVNGGIAGFYLVGTTPANPGYQLTLDVQTVGVEPATWSTVKDLYR